MARHQIVQSRRPAADPIEHLDVREQTLPNGLKVLVLARPAASVVVCDLYYPVGSADERPGKTGLAHFVEHMLFKGTARFPKGTIDQLAFAAAGEANAETAEDFTHYWFRLPRDSWELALAVEADRMAGALFDPEEVEAERRVIVEERARDLDAPAGRLDEVFLERCYPDHPYRHPILGWPDDLARIRVADLRRFYRRHYRPDGAVLVLVGDLDPDRTFDRVRSHFAPIPAGPAPRPARRAPTPSLSRRHRRSHKLRVAETITRGLTGWHTVPINHPDAPALGLLADILGSGRNSRLQQRLIEQDRLAVALDVSHDLGRLAGQLVVSIEAAPGATPRRIEGVLDEEVARLAADGPSDAELARCRTRLDAAWRWLQDDPTALSSALGASALWGDWRTWPNQHRAALAATPLDIHRVTETYLKADRSTAVWSIPGARPASARPSTEPALPLPRAVPAVVAPRIVPPRPPASLRDFRPRRSVLPNGLRLISQPTRGGGVVALELYVEAGQRVEARPGLAYLTARLREEGTTSRPAEALSAAVEDVGGALEVYSKGTSFHARREDLALAIELLADVTLRPAFPADALPWVRDRIAADLRADRDDPAFRADAAFRRLVYGDHPYSRDPRGTLSGLDQLKLADVRAHHARWVRPDRAFLVAVGDFDPAELEALARDRLGRWRARGPRPRLPARPAPPAPRPVRRRTRTSSEQVHLLIGHLGIPRSHPDFDALYLLDHVLGSGPGFSDRLGSILRDRLGLAYTVSGGITDSADLEPGAFRVYVGTSPQHARRAEAAVIEQVRQMHAGHFSDAEVEQARQYLQGAWLFDYQGIAQRADRLLDLESLGLPLDQHRLWPDRLARISPDQVRAAAARNLRPDALARIVYGPP